ncbi:DegT/DnrJ/EryC1/StrS family aminotransferase [Sphingobacterium sp. SGL-16]|uniref:DegT/DnrJ/EryC1/StrS family aminotransferase n=1 Tax=Sphingobacterium sp. SGL-16 TaxID=2710883 RepID=UPI0013EC77AC|nr:DegT/DnrJ/EryC1/StrS family aminotransferase [Sphingobacterium sp. SGL-16]NGM73063.1 aminotransferase class V-fold PLP-dependent enzyme [Sphingobacterium sp. SGL-16]
MKDKIWLSSPHMSGNEIKYINSAFEENWVAPLGPNVNGLEDDLTQFLGQNVHIAALSSGTAALHLALIQCGVKRGDFVICQSLTFSASANPIAYLGAQPVFIDSELDTWNMCPEALNKALKDLNSLNNVPKAIIVVHLYGMPAKMDEIMKIAKEYDIPIIEDAAESLGSSYKKRYTSTIGDFGILSFNGNKIITTSGGGALVCKRKEDKDMAVFLSTQARDEAPHYQHSKVGYNYRMSNISAGIGRGQMEVLKDRIFARRENNLFYKNLFKSSNGISLLCEPNEDYFSNHWLTAIKIDENITGFNREDLRSLLLSFNIESRPIWKPMHMQPVFIDCKYYGNDTAEKLFKNGLCLPSGSNLSENDKNRIAETIKFILN